MQEDMTGWTARSRPVRQTIEGRYVRLEPLDADLHGRDLYRASDVSDAAQKFRWLGEYSPTDEANFLDWVRKVQVSDDPLFSAIIDRETGSVAGRQTLMRIDTANGVIEIGNIYWGPLIARKRGATEAFYLAMKHVFDDLGYRRFEWKCNNDNLPSKRAAERFGFTFEGIFRQHMIVKHLNRDTAWFSIIDKDWPALKAGYEAWLSPENFDAAGQQRRKLQDFLR
jgi:RimJ/RimL family protein N-acetyltransferase